MKQVTYSEFKSGSSMVNGVSTPLVDGENVEVVYGNNTVEKRVYYLPEVESTDGFVVVITQKQFRDRFSNASKLALDKLQQNIDNDAVALTVCTNLDSNTYPLYKDSLRSLFSDLYYSGSVWLGSTEVTTGVNFLASVGAITVAEAVAVLDMTNFELT